ncbi:hypothetical protein FN846DRAFT_967679, partial [Sphaerosporella brunnea]
MQRAELLAALTEGKGSVLRYRADQSQPPNKDAPNNKGKRNISLPRCGWTVDVSGSTTAKGLRGHVERTPPPPSLAQGLSFDASLSGGLRGRGVFTRTLSFRFLIAGVVERSEGILTSRRNFFQRRHLCLPVASIYGGGQAGTTNKTIADGNSRQPLKSLTRVQSIRRKMAERRTCPQHSSLRMRLRCAHPSIPIPHFLPPAKKPFSLCNHRLNVFAPWDSKGTKEVHP